MRVFAQKVTAEICPVQPLVKCSLALDLYLLFDTEGVLAHLIYLVLNSASSVEALLLV